MQLLMPTHFRVLSPHKVAEASDLQEPHHVGIYIVSTGNQIISEQQKTFNYWFSTLGYVHPACELLINLSSAEVCSCLNKSPVQLLVKFPFKIQSD